MATAVSSLVNALMRAVAGVAYPGKASRLPIIVHHRVLERVDPLLPDTIDARALDEHFEMLARLFTVLPLDEAVEMAAQGTLPRRAVSITFDDGYRDNFDVALPILKKHRLTATVYLASSFLDGGRMFCDTAIECARRLPAGEIDLTAFGLGRRQVGDVPSRIRIGGELNDVVKYRPVGEREALCERIESLVDEPLPKDLMMTSDQVTRASREGITFGGHTVNHPNMAGLDAETARREIVHNREAITALTGRPPRTFAYPFGKPGANYTTSTMALVREAGYASAVSMSWGVATVDSQRFQLPRFGPAERHGKSLYTRMLKMARHANPPLLPAVASVLAR
jgi:peptidoglycan/xylan/chitin deacetylase (PgdA/CDA1 family)